jgi:nucleoside-diphosphate-sugar epimerase
MKFLVTGATGYVGSRVVQALRRRGHHAVGLVRTVETAERLRAAGVEATLGDLAQPSSFRAAACAADGVIHTAFGHGMDFFAAVEEERRAVASLIEAYAGTGKPLVVSTATGVVGDTGPEPVDESFPGQPDFPARVRMGVEEDLKVAAERSVRTVVVRPAIFVHGHGASQFVPMLVAIARQSGEAGYLGDGRNRIATVHVDDLAELFVLAAESGEAGTIYNGAGGDISTVELAVAIAAGNSGVRPLSYTPERASEVWGPFPAMLLGINNRASGERSRRELGWRPYERTPDLAEDLSAGSYADRTATAAE